MEGRNKPVTRSSATVYPDDASILHPNDQQYGLYLQSWIVYLVIFCFVSTIGWLVASVIAVVTFHRYLPLDPEIRVQSFSVSNFTSTNVSQVSFAAEIRFTALNPSGRVSISYDKHMVAGLYYKSMLLSQSSLAPFSQKPGNKTSLVVELAADVNLEEKWVVDGINADIEQNGRAEFAFLLGSSATWNSKRGSSRSFLKVLCGNLTVAIPGDGRPGGLIESPRPCRVVEVHDPLSD